MGSTGLPTLSCHGKFGLWRFGERNADGIAQAVLEQRADSHQRS